MTETAPVPVSVEVVPTTPYKDQKPGTSGLRKKTTIFSEGHYLHNFIQVSQPVPPVAILLSSLLSMLWVKRIIRVKLLLLVVMEGILLQDTPHSQPHSWSLMLPFRRYFSREATQIIAKIAAANGVRRLWIAKDCMPTHELHSIP